MHTLGSEPDLGNIDGQDVRWDLTMTMTRPWQMPHTVIITAPTQGLLRLMRITVPTTCSHQILDVAARELADLRQDDPGKSKCALPSQIAVMTELCPNDLNTNAFPCLCRESPMPQSREICARLKSSSSHLHIHRPVGF